MRLAQVTATSLNVRRSPDIKAETVNSLSRGSRVLVVNEVDGGDYEYLGTTNHRWSQVLVNNILSYVASSYLDLESLSPEMRGVWVPDSRFTPQLKSLDGIRQLLDKLCAFGFNTVFLAVWNRGYTAYPSTVMQAYGFDAQDSNYNNFDPLAAMLAEGKKRTMLVIPWFEYGFASSPQSDGGPILRAKPSWGAQDPNGKLTQHGNLYWMNSLHPEVQTFLIELILEVVTTYSVAGVQGDDHLAAMPFNSGYDTFSKNLYFSSTGQQPPVNDPQNSEWTEFRSRQMTEFLRKLVTAVKAINPRCLISMAPSPMPFGKKTLMQDSEQWLQQDLVDFLHPQLYRQTSARYRNDLLLLQQNWLPQQRAKVAPGITFVWNQQPVSPTDILDMIEQNRALSLAGEVFFHYGNLGDPGTPLASAFQSERGYLAQASLPASIASA